VNPADPSLVLPRAGDCVEFFGGLAIERDRTNREYLSAMKPGIDCLT
jgi:hypothetical protein